MYFFIKIIIPALAEFYYNDVELIRLGVSEMTIQFRIAKYLSNFIEPKCNLRIDCEYNRNMYNIKKLMKTMYAQILSATKEIAINVIYSLLS